MESFFIPAMDYLADHPLDGLLGAYGLAAIFIGIVMLMDRGQR